MTDKSAQRPGSKGGAAKPAPDADTEFQDGSDQSVPKRDRNQQSGVSPAEEVEEQGSVEKTIARDER